MLHHTAYLRSEVVFSFASDAVSDENKTAVSAALLVVATADDDEVVDMCSPIGWSETRG